MAANITATQLYDRLNAGEAIDLIDVREDWELEMASVEQAIHIPMDSIPESLDQIAKDKPVVIMCHMGSRSQSVANWLEQQGYSNVLNLSGGIHAWALEVDGSVGMY